MNTGPATSQLGRSWPNRHAFPSAALTQGPLAFSPFVLTIQAPTCMKMDQHSPPCTAYVRCRFCFITRLPCAHASLQVSISAPCPFSAPTDVTAPTLSPCIHMVHLAAGLHLHQFMPSSSDCQGCCPPTRHAWFPPDSALLLHSASLQHAIGLST